MSERSIRQLSDLSPARLKLAEIIRRLGFGYIVRLPIRDGDPVLNPGLAIYSTHKYMSERNLPPIHEGKGCGLKKQFVYLFDHFDRQPNMVIERLDFQDGLPMLWVVKETIV